MDIKEHKIKKYKEALKVLLDDDIFEEINLSDKHEDNNKEDYKVVNYIKDINELNKEDYNIIKKQDEYRQYSKLGKYSKKGAVLYGVSNTVVGIGSLLWIF